MSRAHCLNSLQYVTTVVTVNSALNVQATALKYIFTCILRAETYGPDQVPEEVPVTHFHSVCLITFNQWFGTYAVTEHRSWLCERCGHCDAMVGLTLKDPSTMWYHTYIAFKQGSARENYPISLFAWCVSCACCDNHDLNTFLCFLIKHAAYVSSHTKSVHAC